MLRNKTIKIHLPDPHDKQAAFIDSPAKRKIINRKAQLVVYIMPGFSQYQEMMKVLGKFKTGSSCLYINKLEDIDLDVFRKLVHQSVIDMQKKYECTTD